MAEYACRELLPRQRIRLEIGGRLRIRECPQGYHPQRRRALEGAEEPNGEARIGEPAHRQRFGIRD